MTELATQTGDVLSFGPFTLVASQRLLTKDGIEIELGGRALDLLLRLVCHPNEPVGKRELLAQVWPDLTVGESSLRFHMANLRKALGDGQDGARYITTFSGRGYCFVAPLSRAGAPLKPSSSATNLPLRPPLVGREDELADVVALLGNERLVTIVGPGGVGKTRLAIASGWRAERAYPDGMWLIDLAPLSEPSLVISAVATALDLARDARELSAPVIASAIHDRRLLLILDNCEHLVGVAAEVADTLMQGAPGLTILATSQESLRLDSEQVYRLEPLALPPADATDVARYGAVALFNQRALAADRRFEMSEASAAAVAEICRRLDGVPLSLEMAAARVPSLGLEGLRSSLDARLQVLSTGVRTSDARHQTLRSTVAWSVGLLDEPERQVFQRLGVFAGGFSLNAAMAVVATGQMEPWSVADAIARLVDKSLVVLDRAEPARYRLLESLRLYARELLRSSGDWDTLAESHAAHFCQVFAPSREAWETTPDDDWGAIYLPELDNLRSALDWALAEPARFDFAVELTASAGFILFEWGRLEEARRIAAHIGKRLDSLPADASVAAILRDASDVLRFSADRDGAYTLLERSAAISRKIGDELGLAKANLGIANLKIVTGRYSEIAPLMRGVRETLTTHSQMRSLSGAMHALGFIALDERNFEEAVDNLNSAAELARRLGSLRREQLAQIDLASAECARGDLKRAIEIGWETVRRSRTLPHRVYVEIALENLASFLVMANRLREARPVAEEALSLVRDQTDSIVLLRNLQQWALIAALEGQDLNAARLIGWVNAAYTHKKVERSGWEAHNHELLVSTLRARMTENELSALAAEGAAWDVTHATDFTFDRIIHFDGQPTYRE